MTAPQSSSRQRLLVPATVQLMLGVSSWSLRKMVRDGRLGDVVVRISPRVTRFDAARLDAWIEAQRTKEPACIPGRYGGRVTASVRYDAEARRHCVRRDTE